MITVDCIQKKIEAAKDILKHPEYSEYMVLDMKIALHEYNRFTYANQILSTLNFSSKVNKLAKDLGSRKQINTDILLPALDHVMKKQPFSQDQLVEWFKYWREFEKMNGMLQDIYDSDPHYIDYDVDFMLLGATPSNSHELDELREEYGNLNCDMRFGKLEVETFIDKAREIISKWEEAIN